MKVVDVLRDMDIFQSLSPGKLDELASLLKERKHREGTIIFREGDPGDAMYIVATGRVKISTTDGDGGERVLAFQSEGGFFGEMALLTGNTRSATVETVTDTNLLALSKEDFDLCVTQDVAVMREIMKVLAARQALDNIRQATGAPPLDAVARGNVYVVFGPRGGSGKSTIAANLGVILAQLHPERVALLDMALTFGHVCLLLNLMPKSSLASASPDVLRQMDRDALNYYAVRHPSTLRVVPAATRPEEGEVISAEHARAAIEMLKRHFTATVIDTDGRFADATLGALELATRVIFVCTPELTTIRDVRECQRIFNDVMRLPPEKILYVLNQVTPHKLLTQDQFERHMGQKIDIELPYGGEIPARAALKGEAFVTTQPGASISKTLDRLARAIEVQAVGVGQAASAGERKRGIFAR